MRIAAVSEDGVTISQHFGRALSYIVVTVEDGKIVPREQRDKLGHAPFAGEPHNSDSHSSDPRRQGFGSAAQSFVRGVDDTASAPGFSWRSLLHLCWL